MRHFLLSQYGAQSGHGCVCGHSAYQYPHHMFKVDMAPGQHRHPSRVYVKHPFPSEGNRGGVPSFHMYFDRVYSLDLCVVAWTSVEYLGVMCSSVSLSVVAWTYGLMCSSLDCLHIAVWTCVQQLGLMDLCVVAWTYV